MPVDARTRKAAGRRTKVGPNHQRMPSVRNSSHARLPISPRLVFHLLRSPLSIVPCPAAMGSQGSFDREMRRADGEVSCMNPKPHKQMRLIRPQAEPCDTRAKNGRHWRGCRMVWHQRPRRRGRNNKGLPANCIGAHATNATLFNFRDEDKRTGTGRVAEEGGGNAGRTARQWMLINAACVGPGV